MNAGSICNREVVVADRDEPLVEGARRMRDHHVGTLVVVDDTEDRARPVGILTDRDIVVGVVAKDLEDLPRLSIGDVMSSDLLTCREDDDVDAVLARMRARGVRRVPVVSRDGALVGLIALDDLLDLLATDLAHLAEIVSREQRREWTLRS